MTADQDPANPYESPHVDAPVPVAEAELTLGNAWVFPTVAAAVGGILALVRRCQEYGGIPPFDIRFVQNGVVNLLAGLLAGLGFCVIYQLFHGRRWRSTTPTQWWTLEWFLWLAISLVPAMLGSADSFEMDLAGRLITVIAGWVLWSTIAIGNQESAAWHLHAVVAWCRSTVNVVMCLALSPFFDHKDGAPYAGNFALFNYLNGVQLWISVGLVATFAYAFWSDYRQRIVRTDSHFIAALILVIYTLVLVVGQIVLPTLAKWAR